VNDENRLHDEWKSEKKRKIEKIRLATFYTQTKILNSLKVLRNL
jgi:hypothetical protein